MKAKPVAEEVPKVYDLSPVSTEAMLKELEKRGLHWDELPWEDCGDCTYIRGFDERTGRCGGGFKPTFLDYSDPHKVGFYAIQCPKRKAFPDTVSNGPRP